MYVESLALENYRNYAHLSVNLSPGINIFFGDNAQGKTNVLEALYMCATTKSHRGGFVIVKSFGLVKKRSPYSDVAFKGACTTQKSTCI